jgi:hypothetical protein
MAKSSKATAQEHFTAEGFEGHYADLDGTTVGFETYTADADIAPMFAGLPDDRCQCPHWGYVIAGRVIFHTAHGDEEYVAGDAYYVHDGHTPELFAGTEVVEFSPTEDLARTMEVVAKNMEAMD